MKDLKMPSEKELYKIVTRILLSGCDVEIRPKADGEVCIYKLERKKQKIED